MAPVGSCRPLPTVHENSEEIKEDGCSQSVSVVQSGWLRLENAPKCQPDSEEVCQSRCNVFCASIINIAVSSELGYGLRRRKKCRCGSVGGLEASPFTAGTSIESGHPPSPSSTLVRGHERYPPPTDLR